MFQCFPTLRKIWGPTSLENILMNVTCEIVCVYPLRKVKLLILWASDVSSLFPRGEIFGVAFLTEVRGAEERGHVTVHKIVRSSFQGSSDLEALRASHRRAN